MADELESRVRDCERHIDRFDGRLARIEDDMRTFRAIPLENAEARGVVERMGKDLHDAFEAIRNMRTDFDSHRQEILKVREVREEKDRDREERERKEKADRATTERRDRWTRVAVIMTLSLAFVSLTINTMLQAL